MATLQRPILRLLARGPATVREVADHLEPPRAYTTVATVLTRLERQGRVRRWKDADSWRYALVEDQHQRLLERVQDLLGEVVGDPEPLLEAFLDGVEERDPALLDKLDQLLEARRQEPS